MALRDVERSGLAEVIRAGSVVGKTLREIAREVGRSDSVVRGIVSEYGVDISGAIHAAKEMNWRKQLEPRRVRAERSMKHIDDEDALRMREGYAGGMSLIDLARLYKVKASDVVFVVCGLIYQSAGGPTDLSVDLPSPGGRKLWCTKEEFPVLRNKLIDCRHAYLDTLR